jgi:hypothetical protein
MMTDTANIAGKIALQRNRVRVDFNECTNDAGAGMNLETGKILQTPKGDIRFRRYCLNVITESKEKRRNCLKTVTGICCWSCPV